MSSFSPTRVQDGPLNNHAFDSPTKGRGGWDSDQWTTGGASGFGTSSPGSALSESAVPPLYERLFVNADPIGGTVSTGALELVLRAGGIKSSAVDKIVNLVADPSSSSRLSKQSFYVALALLAFAQTHHELSIEAVSASRDALPIPTLPSTFSAAPLPTMTSETRATRSASDASLDPWNTGPRISPGLAEGYGVNSNLGFSILEDDGPANAFGEDLPANGFSYGVEGWALGKQDKVEVTKREELGGWILKHDVYYVRCEKTGSQVERRYNDFVFLANALVRRYPFRMLPSLPPKRVAVSGHYLGSDDLFIERRRRGLARFLTFCDNHPTLKRDGLLHTFLTEQTDLALWRKDRPISLDEESTSRSLTPGEEMLIPEDLETKLASLRSRITLLVDHWTKICSTYDRIAHRRENQGADWTRLRVGMDAVVETERSGWRVAEVEGVESEEVAWAEGVGRAGEIEGASAGRALDSTVEELKRHRELYVNFKELLVRQTTLSPDAVDKLKARVSASLTKLESLRDAQKENYETDVDRLASSIEADQRGVDALLRRRIFIRYCMWEEMLFLWRSTSLLSSAFKEFAREEGAFAKRMGACWAGLGETLGA